MATTSSTAGIIPTETCGCCGISQTTHGKSLSRCGKCKSQLYCRKECQKNDWSAHKTACKATSAQSSGYTKGLSSISELPVDGILVGAGVWITPARDERVVTGYACVLAATSQLAVSIKSFQSTPLNVAVAQAIGFPLHLYGVNGEDTNDPNVYTEMLGLNPDANSPSFGECCWTTAPTGSALVARADGQPLHILQVNVLVHFCVMVRMEIEKIKKKGLKGKQSDMQNLATRFLNPGAFKRFFDDMKKKETADNPKAWEGVNCPV